MGGAVVDGSVVGGAVLVATVLLVEAVLTTVVASVVLVVASVVLVVSVAVVRGTGPHWSGSKRPLESQTRKGLVARADTQDAGKSGKMGCQ